MGTSELILLRNLGVAQLLRVYVSAAGMQIAMRIRRSYPFAVVVVALLMSAVACRPSRADELGGSASSTTGGVPVPTLISQDDAAVRCDELLESIDQTPYSIVSDAATWAHAMDELDADKIAPPPQWASMSRSDAVVFCTLSTAVDEARTSTTTCPDGSIASVSGSIQSRYVVRARGPVEWIRFPDEQLVPDSPISLCS